MAPKFSVAPIQSGERAGEEEPQHRREAGAEASHDGSGWRRRGAISKSSASAATTSAIVSGQRTTSNARPQPAASASASPATSSTAASSVAAPAVTIRPNATAYLRSGGRSRSTP